MGRLVVVNATSLDGFYEGPHQHVDAVPMDSAFSKYNLERMKAADAVLLGAKSFQMFAGYWPQQAGNPEASRADQEISRLYRPLQKVVVSDHTAAPEQGHPWAGTVRIVKREDAHAEVVRLKRAVPNDREIVMWGSRTLWSELLAQHLVDELHLIVGAALIGSGTPLFTEVRVGVRPLETHIFPHSNSVLLRYEIEKGKT